MRGLARLLLLLLLQPTCVGGQRLQAVPLLIKPAEPTGRITLAPEGLAVLRAQREPFGIITAVGQTRTGKSTILGECGLPCRARRWVCCATIKRSAGFDCVGWVRLYAYVVHGCFENLIRFMQRSPTDSHGPRGPRKYLVREGTRDRRTSTTGRSSLWPVSSLQSVHPPRACARGRAQAASGGALRRT